MPSGVGLDVEAEVVEEVDGFEEEGAALRNSGGGTRRVFELQGRARRGTHLRRGMDAGHELGILVLSVREPPYIAPSCCEARRSY
jgi:hypothetical protein